MLLDYAADLAFAVPILYTCWARGLHQTRLRFWACFWAMQAAVLVAFSLPPLFGGLEPHQDFIWARLCRGGLQSRASDSRAHSSGCTRPGACSSC